MDNKEIKKRENNYSVQKSLAKFVNTPNLKTNLLDLPINEDSNFDLYISILNSRLGKNWRELKKISCYQHKKKKFFCGIIQKLNEFSTETNTNTSFKDIGIDFDREKFLKLIEQHEKTMVVFFNNYYYDFLHIGEICRILENKIRLKQNNNGQLLCLKDFYFALINPVKLE